MSKGNELMKFPWKKTALTRDEEEMTFVGKQDLTSVFIERTRSYTLIQKINVVGEVVEK